MRQVSLFAQQIAWLFFLALLPMNALAQAPAKEAFPFDWLRHDAPPSNRAAGSTIYPPTESQNDQKRRQQIEPTTEEPQAAVAPAEAPIPAVSPPLEREPVLATVEASIESAAPTPTVRPTFTRAPAHSKPTPPMEEIDVINKRSVTLNELKLVSLKEGRRPFIVKPNLKPGQTLTVEIPRDWGCIFLVWTQFSEEPSEQYDGVDLCGDRKINLID